MPDATLLVLFWLMIALFVMSLAYPWRFQTRAARICAHIPGVIIALYVVYETLMPPEMNIRIDLFIIFPIVIVSIGVYLLKLLRLKRAGSTTAIYFLSVVLLVVAFYGVWILWIVVW